jgi:hypothetical protein
MNTPGIEQVSGFMESMAFEDEDSVYDFEENSPTWDGDEEDE